MAHKRGQPRAVPWSPEEDRQLRIAFSKRLVHPEITLKATYQAAALATGRTVMGCRQRADLLGLHVQASVRHLRAEEG